MAVTYQWLKYYTHCQCAEQ